MAPETDVARCCPHNGVCGLGIVLKPVVHSRRSFSLPNCSREPTGETKFRLHYTGCRSTTPFGGRFLCLAIAKSGC